MPEKQASEAPGGYWVSCEFAGFLLCIVQSKLIATLRQDAVTLIRVEWMLNTVEDSGFLLVMTDSFCPLFI